MTRGAESSQTAFDAAVKAVDAETATRSKLSEHDIAEGSVLVVAIGKAAPAMARGAAAALDGHKLSGVVVSDHHEVTDDRFLSLLGDHPVPGRRSFQAGQTILDQVHRGGYALLLVLVSGGGSSLVEVPSAGLRFSDVTAVGETLVRSGADIFEMNTVRRHLSQIKNGNLLRASVAPVITLLIDDVHSGSPSAIASGPTLYDNSTAEDAIDTLIRMTDPAEPYVQRVVQHLGTTSLVSPISSAEHEFFVVADRFIAADAAVTTLRRGGLNADSIESALTGPATTMTVRALHSTPPGSVRVFTGETTVNVTGSEPGGRNHHAALQAALWLDGNRLNWFAAFGTDGIDGTTPSAGAIVDGFTALQIRDAGVEPEVALRDCASWGALDRVGASVRTGATGTNVGDLWLVAASEL